MGVTVDGVVFDISLERSTGEKLGLMIVPHSDRRERISDFAPTISTTGDLAYQSGIWRPWTQSDWSSGLGQEVWDSSQTARFYEAENVETRIRGKVMLATAVSVTDASIAAAQPVDFNSKVYMRCTGTNLLREYTDGVGWASGTPAVVSSPSDLVVYGAKLYAASANSHYGWLTTGGTWIAGPLDREHFATWNPGATPSLWGSHGSQVFSSTDGSTWGTAISVGDTSANITALAPFDQVLYIGKEDGLYYLDADENVFQMIDCKNRLWANNFIGGLVEFEGFLYFSILKRIYKYSSSAIVDITPATQGSLVKETYGYGFPEAFVASPTALYVGFDLAENDYAVVLAYNGLGWHPIYKGDAGSTFHGMGYSSELDWFLFNDGSTKYKPLPSMTDLPYPSFSTTGTGVLTFPKFDGDMPQTAKACKSVVCHTRDCSATEKITIQYCVDDSSTWVEAGSITSSPQEELSLSALAGAIEVDSNIQIRALLTTGTPTVTPVLEHFALLWLPRPPATFAHQVSVRLGTPIPLG